VDGERKINKINILFVMVQMEMGGSERLVHNLALKLDRALFNPSVAWVYGDRILKEFSELEIPLYHVPKVKGFDIYAMYKIGKVIRDNNIHVINAHHFMPMVYSFYGCKISNHIKLFCTLHSEWEIERISWKWKAAGSCLLKRADGAVGVSSKVSEAIRENFNLSADKVFTIRNGVDLKIFSNRIDKRAVIRKEFNLEDNEKVIGMVANFKKIKNHAFMLKAFSGLTKKFAQVKLLLIGQGFKEDPQNSEEEILSFVNQNDLNRKVLLLGYRSDVSELLGIMDIFCLTSFKEGLPISLIEAMAAGLPVVGTDVEGIKDVVIHEKNGFLVQLEDVDGLRDALYRLLNDESLRERCGHESKSLVANTYSLERCINEYQNLFLSVRSK
jgi:L-malate glycosyltransferase